MFQFTSAVISFFVAFPIICYLLIFILCKQITKKHRLSVNFALDISTLFFIISVHFLIVSIWGESLLSYILLVILFIGVFMVILHWKVKQEIVYRKVFRGFWRINFLLFFCAYLFLMAYGLIYYVIKQFSI
ncbi:DUF3397 domain-containing protein [Niallia taxi]|uniref:DUF3397 domain-containing protein n=1 Tax=Niallia taxi TaxID=2499688 RepID=A0A437KG70_9BACI|nr:DUF3397 domain-containing protein [Niallia taxi]MCM3214851.1 DUF3397 domain-containing protein [Niallia taxi]MDK8638752.1 DUF3397 domain-containing protein [Niallia taxi]MED4037709.1 DUF3397 domain-containing protein [Niallia taxi]MED4053626.1 DUF3397 domain-containing protein [Niallia taxi]MED4119466.1 DUF3397 domain-containing protein [Niallia taxi]